ncbi:DoxX family protein [Pedosphaera parvula]|uniref:DoxX family protein n=1 Tax=Pedosphaera parvula (strain Ellin514) TaxID=320771 RepID=B9XM80_PEDPL|nr:DoxX family protein [Pedosphaera parvula]EEF59073.1 DoxX family protein [Pedosphaera parvula Ellin514]
MKTLKSLFKTTDDNGALVLRLGLAAVMFPHGAQKVLGWFGGYGFTGTMNFFTQTMHIPAPLAALAMTAEFLGPIALVFGLLSRVAAFGIGFTISVAAFTVALPNGFFMNWFGNQKGEGVEYHILMAVIALAVVIKGGGKWALDSVIARQLERTEVVKASAQKQQVAVAR